MAERECPTCRVALLAANFGPLALDACLHCGGVWFDSNELEQLLQGGAGAIWKLRDHLRGAQKQLVPPGQGFELCPACRTPLGILQFANMPGLRLTSCVQCNGYWVDAELLLKIATRLSESALGAAAVDKPKSAEIGTVDLSRLEQSVPLPAAPAQNPALTLIPHSRVHEPPSEARKAPGGANTCPDCGQPNAAGAAVCWACGRLLGGNVAGVCPRCHGSFHKLDSDGVALEACDGCGGIHLKAGKLNELLFQTEAQQRKLMREIEETKSGRIRERQSDLRCRDCGVPMISKPLGKLTMRHIYNCPQCRCEFVDNNVLPEILTVG
jgi:Zn-finger nucleic acid-binding protein